MFHVLVYLAFVFVPVAELDHGAGGGHGVVEERAVVGGLVVENHLS